MRSQTWLHAIPGDGKHWSGDHRRLQGNTSSADQTQRMSQLCGAEQDHANTGHLREHHAIADLRLREPEHGGADVQLHVPHGPELHGPVHTEPGDVGDGDVEHGDDDAGGDLLRLCGCVVPGIGGRSGGAARSAGGV